MSDDFLLDEKPRSRWRRFLSFRIAGRTLAAIGLLLVLGLLLYYPVGMLLIHKIDDDPDFQAPAPPEGGSYAVALAAALVDREVAGHGWPANDPFFMPGWALDNMPNYQMGIIAALSRFALEMTDQIGRTRGTSQADPDLDKATGLLRYSGTVWIFDFSTSWAPTASSEQQYLSAARALDSFNRRLSAGQAVFERRADNLLGTLDRIAADLGSASALTDRRIEDHSGDLIDFRADDVFYSNKGRLYAYGLLLREIGRDFEQVIRERDLVPVWEQMLDSFRQAAALEPWVVTNGAPDGQFVPSHLAAQGFFLLRARTQLREVSNILLK
ncbi:MAG: DUF2333 family protein [Dongiaceae bacterium]